MSLLDVHREINRQTHIQTRQHRKRLSLISAIFTALLTFAWYEMGIIQTSPMYRDLSPIIGLGFTLFQTFIAIFIIQIVMIYFVTAGKYTAPKVINGYWKVHSKLVIPEKVRMLTANGIWEYIKLHRKHDSLYQADLERLRTEMDDKLKTKADKNEIDEVRAEFERKMKVKDLVIRKEHNLRIQAEWERDKEKNEKEKWVKVNRVLLKAIFKLREEIKKLKGE